MQKGVGSNPISRFQKRLQIAGVSSLPAGLCVDTWERTERRLQAFLARRTGVRLNPMQNVVGSD
jgi:hypothetical protein